MYTAPVELNAGELGALGIRGGELVVSGYLPVMVSAQCLRKNVSGCAKQNGSMKLTDRYGNPFLTKNYCRPCYNVVYNSVPLWLGGEMERIRRLGPAYLRVQLTEESPEQTCGIIRSLAEQMDGGRGCAERDGGRKYTLGHFNRGII